MTERTERLRLQDLMLTVLCTAAGPALWWSGGTLQDSSGGSSAAVQLEIWVAGALAMIGVLIASWWAVALLGALLCACGARRRDPAMLRWGQMLSPTFLRRVAAATLGVQVLAAPGAWASPAYSPPTPSWAQESTAAASHLPSLAEDGEPRPHWTDSVIPAAPVRAAAHAETSQTRDQEAPPSPRWRPDTPVPTPPGSTDRVVEETPTVTVRRGDCLWDIAAEELGPHATDREVDRRWREWHEANRETIGPDPHLLVPGTVLTAPTWT